MTGTDYFRILLDNTLHGPSTLRYIPLQPPYEADIRGSIDIELQIQKIADALVIEYHQAIDDYKLRRLDAHHLIHAAMMHEIILRHHYRRSGFEIGEILDHQIHIEGIGMVEIICRYIVVADEWSALVVAVLGYKHGGVNRLLYPSHDSTLSRSGSSGDSYQPDIIHIIWPLLYMRSKS